MSICTPPRLMFPPPKSMIPLAFTPPRPKLSHGHRQPIAVDGDGEIREMQLGIGGGGGFIIAAGTQVQRAGDDAGVAQNMHGGRRIDVGQGDRPGVAEPEFNAFAWTESDRG